MINRHFKSLSTLQSIKSKSLSTDVFVTELKRRLKLSEQSLARQVSEQLFNQAVMSGDDADAKYNKWLNGSQLVLGQLKGILDGLSVISPQVNEKIINILQGCIVRNACRLEDDVPNSLELIPQYNKVIARYCCSILTEYFKQSFSVNQFMRGNMLLNDCLWTLRNGFKFPSRIVPNDLKLGTRLVAQIQARWVDRPLNFKLVGPLAYLEDRLFCLEFKRVIDKLTKCDELTGLTTLYKLYMDRLAIVKNTSAFGQHALNSSANVICALLDEYLGRTPEISLFHAIDAQNLNEAGLYRYVGDNSAALKHDPHFFRLSLWLKLEEYRRMRSANPSKFLSYPGQILAYYGMGTAYGGEDKLKASGAIQAYLLEHDLITVMQTLENPLNSELAPYVGTITVRRMGRNKLGECVEEIKAQLKQAMNDWVLVECLPARSGPC